MLVAKDGKIIVDKFYGTLDRAKGSAKVDDETIYDLASMSKVCGTLSALMKTYDKGKWKLDDKIEKFIPELKDKPLGKVTMQQLLYHQSGLPAMLNVFKLVLDTATYEGDNPIKYKYAPPFTVKIADNVYGHNGAKLRSDLFSTERSKKYHLPVADGIYASDSARIAVMEAIYDIDPKKGNKYVYSDLNFCLLMQIQENITRKPFDEFVEDEVFEPLNMWHTGYNPSEYYDMKHIAPTEVDNYLRKQHVKGYVHDETAAFSGGIQGNAGLFSNVNDLVRLFQTWLDGGSYDGKQIFSPETVELFTSTKSRTADRFLGFDTLTSKRSWGVSSKTYGHTGFTGTCFWIDPDNGLIYIFLSNRVNPSRNNSAFTKINPRYSILQEVYKALPDAQK